MATINIETTITSGSYHKRSTKAGRPKKEVA